MEDDRDCPPNIIEVRRNPDGSLDEVVADNCFFHLEQMSDGHWWMAVTKDGYRQVINISAVSAGKCEAFSEMDDWPDMIIDPK